MSRRLLIVDRYDAPALTDLDQTPDAADWDVLLLGLSNCWWRWRHRAAPGTWRLVDPSPLAHDAADHVGTFLVDFVRRLPDLPLGGTTFHDLLAAPHGSQWWFMDIAEKGPLRGPLVGQLYRCQLADLVIKQGGYAEVRLQLREGVVADILSAGGTRPGPHVTRIGVSAPASRAERPLGRYWFHAIVEAVRAAAVKTWLAVWGQPHSPEAGALSSFTFYPSWWSRPLSSAASDRFFSHLGDAGIRTYLTWVNAPGTLWRHPRKTAQVMRARGMSVLQGALSWAEIAGLLSLRRFRRIQHFERAMRPKLSARMGALDVSALVGAELSRSLSGGELAMSSLLSAAVRQMTLQAAPRAVLFRTEFQPFENALMRGLRGRGAAVGFLHYPFGRHYLSTRFAPGEVAAYLAAAGSPNARPLADGIVACGEVGISRLMAAEYPQSRCAPCGPQRFGRLLTYLRTQESREAVRNRLGLPLDQPVYFVTLAIVPEDTEALFGALGIALGDSAPYRLVVRTHPNRPEGDAPLRAALAALGPGRAALMPAAGDIYDYMCAADAMVCVGSMIAFEAMALGCMPVVFENPSTFPALSLAEFQDSLFVARDADELRAAFRDITGRTPAALARRAEWPNAVGKVLGDTVTSLPVQLGRALSQLEVVVS